MNRKQLTIEAELTLEELRFAEDLRGIVRSNLQKVYSAINFGQVNTNWNIGRLKSLEKDIHKPIAKVTESFILSFRNLQLGRHCLPNSKMNWSGHTTSDS